MSTKRDDEMETLAMGAVKLTTDFNLKRISEATRANGIEEINSRAALFNASPNEIASLAMANADKYKAALEKKHGIPYLNT